MFVTPGSFTPPGRVMLQILVPQTGSKPQNQTRALSKVGKQVGCIADTSKRGRPRAYKSANPLEVSGPDRWIALLKINRARRYARCSPPVSIFCISSSCFGAFLTRVLYCSGVSSGSLRNKCHHVPKHVVVMGTPQAGMPVI